MPGNGDHIPKNRRRLDENTYGIYDVPFCAGELLQHNCHKEPTRVENLLDERVQFYPECRRTHIQDPESHGGRAGR